MDTTRREFIRLIAGFALASPGGCAGADSTALPGSGGNGKILPDVIYRLFPHPRLSQDVYEQVTKQLRERIGQSAELTAMMDSAMEALSGNSPENWFALAERGKTEALEKIRHTPFFQFVLNEALSGVYRHTLTWELLGYEGSSLEFGGYINRGFNDIDWLPE